MQKKGAGEKSVPFQSFSSEWGVSRHHAVGVGVWWWGGATAPSRQVPIKRPMDQRRSGADHKKRALGLIKKI